jgi:hypothetical protein
MTPSTFPRTLARGSCQGKWRDALRDHVLSPATPRRAFSLKWRSARSTLGALHGASRSPIRTFAQGARFPLRSAGRGPFVPLLPLAPKSSARVARLRSSPLPPLLVCVPEVVLRPCVFNEPLLSFRNRSVTYSIILSSFSPVYSVFFVFRPARNAENYSCHQHGVHIIRT